MIKKNLVSGPFTEKVLRSLDYTHSLYSLTVHSPFNPLQSLILPVKLLTKITDHVMTSNPNPCPSDTAGHCPANTDLFWLP